MKTNLEKLRELLCTVPEIEKDIKELKLGTKIKTMFGIYKILVDNKHYIEKAPYKECLILMNGQEEIIGNQLKERHLRIYCKEKEICLMINEDIKTGETVLSFNGNEVILDDTKDLENQSEETLGKILDFLTK